MKQWIREIDEWVNRNRPWALVLAVMLWLLIIAQINSATGSDLFRQFLYPKSCKPEGTTLCDPLAWKDLFQAALVILGLPVAFLLWHWRDRNVRDQIENARKDVNLKEFQEVQLRAAGALDDKLPLEAREQLQIAALHQLRGFLRGDYGESFKRPAMELLLAGHAAAIYRIDVPDVQTGLAGKSRSEFADATQMLESRLTTIDRARMRIICDEAMHIFTPDYPLDGRRFDLLNLIGKKFPDNLRLASSHFFRTRLDHVQLRSVDFYRANLEGAMLASADLENANLNWAHLGSATLIRANLRGAKMKGVTLDNNTDLEGASFSDLTSFGDSNLTRLWFAYSEEEKATERQQWIARGMINFDDRPSHRTVQS